MKITRLIKISLLAICVFAPEVSAQQSVVDKINQYGKFDTWSRRQIEESMIIGGQTKYLYEFYGNTSDVRATGKAPLVTPPDYLWRTNNVLAVVAGIVKTSNTVYPERRGFGYCARLETHIEKVTALGTIDMQVVCQGAMLLGKLPEPIKDTKSPMSKVLYGIPFKGRPKAVRLDYKADVGHEVIRGTGFSKLKPMGYPDAAEITVILQKRWEDKDGNIHALRVGTGIERIEKDIPNWINDHDVVIRYGDITKQPYYKSYMGLKNTPETAYHALNSKGKNVVVQEEGWAPAGTEPNFLMIHFIASCGQAFYGGVGNTLWIDNVEVIM